MVESSVQSGHNHTSGSGSGNSNSYSSSSSSNNTNHHHHSGHSGSSSSNNNNNNPSHPLINGLGEALKLGRDGFENLLEAQRELIHSQLKDLQRLALQQCQMTGTNPLAQEMAAAVLGQNVGKKAGETFTPKALKCLYNVFSIKDTITKKEARDLSALTGATITQVREFFAGQRARVRKIVQLSHGERTIDPSLDIGLTIDGSQEDGDTKIPSSPKTDAQDSYVWLSDVLQQKVDGKELSSAEKAEKLINAMRKEKTFLGQTQLAEIVLQTHRAVLRCLMVRGGLQQITKWLMQAAMEEQTSLIRVLLKALNQFPLGSTLPRQMSLLLQTINKLRFHRAPDVASCARSLLSRWSKFLKTPQNGKIAPSTGLTRISQTSSHKHNRDDTTSHADDDTLLKKSKISIMVDSNHTTSDVASSSFQTDKPTQPRDEAVTATDIESFARKRVAAIRLQGDRFKQKRKVQLVEASVRRRDMDGVRTSSFEATPRPLSADDIRKAKQRAYFLNSSKAQKPLSSNPKSIMSSNLGASTFNHSDQQNLGSCSNQGQVLESVSGNLSSNLAEPGGELGSALKEESMEKSSFMKVTVTNTDLPEFKVSDVKLQQAGEQVSDVKVEQDSEPQNAQVESAAGPEVEGFEVPKVKDGNTLTAKQLGDMSFLESTLIHWVEPPRVFLDPQWRVASGEQSAEVHSQSLRLSNAQEFFYSSLESIPLNPEEPAERICLFVDEASVPEILLESIDEESIERDSALQSPNDESTRQEEEANKVESTLCVSEDKERSLLQLSSGPCHKEQQMGMLNAPGFFSDVDALHRSSIGTHIVASTLSQKSDDIKEIRDTSFHHANTILKMEQGSTGIGHDMIHAKEENLADSLGTRNTISLPRKESEAVSGMRSSGLQPSQLLDPSSSTGRENTGLNISELSPEACAEMLKVVLPQLADNGKGFGADLGLLSVFLKNPELVHTLMSSGAGSNAESLKDSAKKDSNSKSHQASNLNIELSKLIAGSLPNEISSTTKIGLPMPKNPVNQVGESFKKPGEIVSPQLLSMSHESQPILHQAAQLKNSQPVQLGTKDVGSANRGQDWIHQYGHLARFDDQGTGSPVARVSSRPAHDHVYTAGEYSQVFQGSNQPIHGRASHAVVPSSPSIQRGQSSMFMQTGRDTTQPIHAVDRQEIALSGRNPQIPYMDLPNQSYPKHRDSGMLATISEAYHPNHRGQPSVSMHDTHVRHAVRGVAPSQVMGNAHLNYGHNYHDQKLKQQHILPPTTLPQARPPPSFATNSVRPQMMWNPQSQINRGRHNRLG